MTISTAQSTPAATPQGTPSSSDCSQNHSGPTIAFSSPSSIQLSGLLTSSAPSLAAVRAPSASQHPLMTSITFSDNSPLTTASLSAFPMPSSGPPAIVASSIDVSTNPASLAIATELPQLNSETNPSQPKKYRKSKQQPVLALSKEEAEISFLKQELNSAQTRITLLDSEIDDLNKTIKIQKQRLKIFEESKSESCPENYSSFVGTRAATACQPPGHTSCCLRPAPPPSCCGHCPQINRNETECSSISKDILHRITILATDIERIKSTLNKDVIGSPTPTQVTTPAGPTALPSVSAPPDSDNVEIMVVERDEQVHESPSDTTINSIEEFLPLPQEEINLNSNLLTIQL